MNKLFLHIGTHKTGSTSLQNLLADHRNVLLENGLAFYDGVLETGNHLELHVAAMRTGRTSFSKEKFNINGDESYIKMVSERVKIFQEDNVGKDIIFSSEALNMLRYDDEIETLKSILNVKNYEVIVVIVLRSVEDFLKSFKAQILKVPNRSPSLDPESHLYIETDSWLVDYAQIQAKWTKHFGLDNYVIIDYDEAMKNENDILPSVLKVLSAPDLLIDASKSYRSNKSGKLQSLKRFIVHAMNR